MITMNTSLTPGMRVPAPHGKQWRDMMDEKNRAKKQRTKAADVAAERQPPKSIARALRDENREEAVETCRRVFILRRHTPVHLYGHPAAGRIWEKERNRVIMEVFNREGWTWVSLWTDDADMIGDDNEIRSRIYARGETSGDRKRRRDDSSPYQPACPHTYP